ncbi:MAG TPA: hypothetical protein VNA24_34815 [Hyalangium sp.]|nr:hypothetical protein [Hyalangium sp.]
MVTSTLLKRRGVLGVAIFLVAVTGCRDFAAAYDKCLTEQTCYLPDGGLLQLDGGGEDDGGTPDSGAADSGTADSGTADSGTADSGTADSGMDAGGMDAGGMDAGGMDDGGMDDGGQSDGGPSTNCDGGLAVCTSFDAVEIVVREFSVCSSGLCLRQEYALSGPYEFQGLWGSGPKDVFLAARARPGFEAPAQMVRFSEDGFSAMTVDLPGFQPFRLHGTGSDNVWAISEAPASGPCWLGDEHLTGPYASPLLHCPSPLFRFDGQQWAPVGYATNGWTTIQPPALFTGLDSTWVASNGQGLLRWTGALWQLEPVSLGTVSPLSALWGDTSGPRIGVGNGSLPLAGFQPPAPWADWIGSPLLESGRFVAIAGPDEEHLYAATASEVLRWVQGGGWQAEFTVPYFSGPSPAVQDIWVSGDGNDVWVTLGTDYVLRKHDGAWSVLQLPVEPGFSALQVEGFDTPAGDLWITGTQSHGWFFGTIAYRYERQDP